MHHKQRCHLKCICDALDEACSSLCNDTPASLMCYASRLVTIRSWARLSSCVVSGPSGIVPQTEGCVCGGVGGGQREGMGVVWLDASSTSQTLGGVIPPLGFAEAAFPPPRSDAITEQNGDGVIGLVCMERSLLMQYFWLLERLSCIMHMKFMESVVV